MYYTQRVGRRQAEGRQLLFSLAQWAGNGQTVQTERKQLTHARMYVCKHFVFSISEVCFTDGWQDPNFNAKQSNGTLSFLLL